MAMNDGDEHPTYAPQGLWHPFSSLKPQPKTSLDFSNPKIRVWKKNPGLQSLINNKQQVVIMVIITARGLMGETKAKC